MFFARHLRPRPGADSWQRWSSILLRNWICWIGGLARRGAIVYVTWDDHADLGWILNSKSSVQQQNRGVHPPGQRLVLVRFELETWPTWQLVADAGRYKTLWRGNVLQPRNNFVTSWEMPPVPLFVLNTQEQYLQPFWLSASFCWILLESSVGLVSRFANPATHWYHCLKHRSCGRSHHIGVHCGSPWCVIPGDSHGREFGRLGESTSLLHTSERRQWIHDRTALKLLRRPESTTGIDNWNDSVPIRSKDFWSDLCSETPQHAETLGWRYQLFVFEFGHLTGDHLVAYDGGSMCGTKLNGKA